MFKKGTYIRTLCRDIGEVLGNRRCDGGAYANGKRRFSVENSVTLKQLEENGAEKFITPVDDMFDYEKIAVSGEESSLRRVLNGNP